jgi:alginate O-acetyltransferase complex protein AlgI
MLFNSINYFLFLFAVFILNYLLPNRFRWILLLLSSIFFYLVTSAETFIIPVIIVVNTFICGKMIIQTQNAGRKKKYLLIGLFINLGFLIFFKYINFIIVTVIGGFNLISHLVLAKQVVNNSSIILQFAVPLGISFITIQAIGYLIEIQRGNINPEKNFGLFATYILFFPKLMSGPIERGNNFIKQLYQKHEFNYEQVIEGLKRILFGLFLKLVVADRLAIYTNGMFTFPELHSGITLLVASVFFTIQLFADFAGYTDIAIGSAQLLGYRLAENFNAPFKSKSITEFWSRWHISLSNWLRDYLFLPISYSVARKYMKKSYKPLKVEYVSYISAVLITMTICGIWHGASWNFVIFGFLQGFIMTLELLTRKLRKRIKRKIPSWTDTLGGIIFTFSFFCFSTIFFRANTTSDAFLIIGKIFTVSGPLFRGAWQQFTFCFLAILLLLTIYFVKELSIKTSFHLKTKFWIVSQVGYLIMIMLILLLGVFDSGQFIYFQF